MQLHNQELVGVAPASFSGKSWSPSLKKSSLVLDSALQQGERYRTGCRSPSGAASLGRAELGTKSENDFPLWIKMCAYV